MSLTSKLNVQLCDPYAWEDPRYIFRASWVDKYFNTRRTDCASEIVNKILFVYLISISLGLLIGFYTRFSNASILTLVIASIFLIPLFKQLQSIYTLKKKSIHGISKSEDKIHAPILKESFVNQSSYTSRNPFQNVLIDEIKYSPTRAAAPDITSPESKIALDEFFRVQWYSDPTDIYGKTQSQRMFITQPVTTIPNDQDSYQKWLYKIPGKTCKEGNPEACYGGTNGAALPWLNL